MESAALPRKARGPGLFLMVVILELPMNCARSSVRVMTIFRIVPIAAIYLAALALSACATPSRLAPEDEPPALVPGTSPGTSVSAGPIPTGEASLSDRVRFSVAPSG